MKFDKVHKTVPKFKMLPSGGGFKVFAVDYEPPKRGSKEDRSMIKDDDSAKIIEEEMFGKKELDGIPPAPDDDDDDEHVISDRKCHICETTDMVDGGTCKSCGKMACKEHKFVIPNGYFCVECGSELPSFLIDESFQKKISGGLVDEINALYSKDKKFWNSKEWLIVLIESKSSAPAIFCDTKDRIATSTKLLAASAVFGVGVTGASLSVLNDEGGEFVRLGKEDLDGFFARLKVVKTYLPAAMVGLLAERIMKEENFMDFFIKTMAYEKKKKIAELMAEEPAIAEMVEKKVRHVMGGIDEPKFVEKVGAKDRGKSEKAKLIEKILGDVLPEGLVDSASEKGKPKSAMDAMKEMKEMMRRDGSARRRPTGEDDFLGGL